MLTVKGSNSEERRDAAVCDRRICHAALCRTPRRPERHRKGRFANHLRDATVGLYRARPRQPVQPPPPGIRSRGYLRTKRYRGNDDGRFDFVVGPITSRRLIRPADQLFVIPEPSQHQCSHREVEAEALKSTCADPHRTPGAATIDPVGFRARATRPDENVSGDARPKLTRIV